MSTIQWLDSSSDAMVGESRQSEISLPKNATVLYPYYMWHASAHLRPRHQRVRSLQHSCGVLADGRRITLQRVASRFSIRRPPHGYVGIGPCFVRVSRAFQAAPPALRSVHTSVAPPFPSSLGRHRPAPPIVAVRGRSPDSLRHAEDFIPAARCL